MKINKINDCPLLKIFCTLFIHNNIFLFKKCEHGKCEFGKCESGIM